MVLVIPFLAHQTISSTDDNTKLKDIFPYFVIGFIIFGCIRSAGDYFFTVDNVNFDLWNNFVKTLKRGNLIPLWKRNFVFSDLQDKHCL